MMFLGVVVSAIVIGPVLELLFQAYGFGGVMPHPGMPAQQMLAAPQSGLMAAVALGVFGLSLPWKMIIAGGVIAIISILIDERLKRKGSRFPVLAVGLSVYLPIQFTTPIILDGLIHYLGVRHANKKTQHLDAKIATQKKEQSQQRSIVMACGLVAGAALMGVAIAIPFAIKGNSNALSLVSPGFTPIAMILGIVATIMLSAWLFHVSKPK